ncbi:Protein phosphatase [Mycena chlorophos]|uniref:Protein phosphatase n=1 Tax=Mycena chlorophos TaxID=658473 RepID=A0A8H6TGY6_MYCCL|nr:Protein phosphatase [Mycena chlorophos]
MSSMKHARFFPRVGVGRVRSNSASRSLYTNPSSLSTFFDASGPPPPPNARLTTHRVPVEGRAEVEGPSGSSGHQTHAPLALAAPHPSTSQHPHPAQLALLFPYAPGSSAKQSSGTSHAASGKPHRRKGPRYTLDIGAYGIPKRGHRTGSRSIHSQTTDAPLAVQVGEDAYFVHENAMGVADGVGGWARVKHLAPPTGPSASALFARRLMHFCADEVDRAAHRSRDVPSQPPIVVPWEAYRPHSYSAASAYEPTPFASTSSCDPWLDESDVEDTEDLAAALDAELDDLADGIDVLNILERAYQRTLEAHVVTVPAEPASMHPTQPPDPSKSPTSWTFLSAPKPETQTVPLRSGGSTALVAVLDYVPASGSLPNRVEVGVEGIGLFDVVDPPHLDGADGGFAPVLKIAHLGDCMGMLVRDGAIAWRSEEMWWRWNTPVQLSAATPAAPAATTTGWWSQLVGGIPDPATTGPSTANEVTPGSAARVFTLPVRAGDILILASDGLGDNLWDEDVLEEVGRVSKAFEAASATDSNELVEHSRLRRQTLAGMLSEALCSRARRIATRRATGGLPCAPTMAMSAPAPSPLRDGTDEDTPFARRAREVGREHSGGKNDDISVVVAVIAPADGDAKPLNP